MPWPLKKKRWARGQSGAIQTKSIDAKKAVVNQIKWKDSDRVANIKYWFVKSIFNKSKQSSWLTSWKQQFNCH
jgi:hypothetical protein